MITAKTEFSQGIDWLQYTSFNHSWPVGWNEDYKEDLHGRWGYNRMRTFRDGRVELWSTDRPEMGHHIVLTASVLARLFEDYGCSPWDVIAALNDDVRFTRLDVCIDIQRGCLDFDDLEIEILYKHMKSRAKTVHRIKAVGAEGNTLYIGDATSPKRLRIYDKAAEQKIEGLEWTRIELQLRKPYAQIARFEIAQRIHDEYTIPGLITGFVDFPEYPDWKRVFENAPILMQSPKPETNHTTKWLLEVVAPSLARHQYNNPSFEILADFLVAYRAEYQKLLQSLP